MTYWKTLSYYKMPEPLFSTGPLAIQTAQCCRSSLRKYICMSCASSTSFVSLLWGHKIFYCLLSRENLDVFCCFSQGVCRAYITLYLHLISAYITRTPLSSFICVCKIRTCSVKHSPYRFVQLFSETDKESWNHRKASYISAVTQKYISGNINTGVL
jgi:hypothetical protein